MFCASYSCSIEYSSVAGGDFYPLAGRLAKTKKIARPSFCLLGNTHNLHLYGVQIPSKAQGQATAPYCADRTLPPPGDLVRLVRLIRTFLRTAGTDSEKLSSPAAGVDVPDQTPVSSRPQTTRLHANPAGRMISAQSAKPPMAPSAYQLPMANADSLPPFRA